MQSYYRGLKVGTKWAPGVILQLQAYTGIDLTDSFEMVPRGGAIHKANLSDHQQLDCQRMDFTTQRYCELLAKSYSKAHYKTEYESCPCLEDISIQSPLSYGLCFIHISQPVLRPAHV